MSMFDVANLINPNPPFLQNQISFVLDHKPMFKVITKRAGKPFTHSVKALKIIWNKFPQWYISSPTFSSLSLVFHVENLLTHPPNPTYRNAHNTIHIDDLSRNFALNPWNGIKIDAFHNCHTLEAQNDRELRWLQRYLRWIAETGVDFKKADHRVSVTSLFLDFLCMARRTCCMLLVGELA